MEQGLNRELEEEINLNLDEVKITESDLISIQRPTVNDEDPNLVCYFYAKGLSDRETTDQTSADSAVHVSFLSEFSGKSCPVTVWPDKAENEVSGFSPTSVLCKQIIFCFKLLLKNI